MPHRFRFDHDILHSVAGGRSALDIPRLNFQTIGEADSFVKAYGFDCGKPGDESKLWYFHRRALVLLTEKLGFTEAEIPEILRDRKQLGDIRQLLLYASSRRAEDAVLQRWACALLRCMHVYVHAENDLFSFFAEEIQAQILTPLQEAIVHDGTVHKTFLRSASLGRAPVELVRFEVKPFKTSASTVIKLLAKPDALAMKVFDKLGVRFITRNLFDGFQVIRFLIEESLISFPHIMPDQSSNNLYPVELFLDVCEEFGRRGAIPDDAAVLAEFEKKLGDSTGGVGLFRKPNEQSADDFRFIKFITRKLIHVAPIAGKESFSFFYPFEVQIMDEKSLLAMQSGPSEHQAYKERQRQAARRRILPENEQTP